MKHPAFCGALILMGGVYAGCKNNPSQDLAYPPDFPNRISAKKLTLVSTGTLEIPLDSVSMNYSHYPVYYANDTIEFYIYGNEIINSMDFYDLDKKKLVRRNMFDKEGDHGIMSTLRIFVKSLDSIYIFDQETRKILLTNYDGKVLTQYTLPPPNPLPTSWMSNLLEPLTIRDGKAFFAFMAHGDNRVQVDHRTLIQYDLRTGRYQETGPPYPAIFSQYLYYNFTPFYTFGHRDNIIVRHGSLPDIYNYDLTTDSTSVIPMKSLFQDKPIEPNKTAKEFMELDDTFEEIAQGNYLGVYYDRYAKIYYSIFKRGMPLQDADGNETLFSDKPASIILFNENFEFCGEVPLKEQTYFDNFICSKKGLLIPTSHPKNPANNENLLQFEIFSLREVE